LTTCLPLVFRQNIDMEMHTSLDN